MTPDNTQPATIDPTLAIYGAIQFAYDYFNTELFDSQLPKGIITFHRQRKVMGYASYQRWKSKDGKRIDELAINPEYFEDYPLIEIFQTLCHEMTHLWQAHFGKPSRRGYHNTEWANKMKAIGLMPSSTGEPGGDTTGEHMMDYVIFDAPFILACQKLVARGFDFPWVDCFPVVRLETPILAYRKDDSPIELDKVFEPTISSTTSPNQLQKKEIGFLSESEEAYVETPSLSWEALQLTEPANYHTTLPVQRSGRVKYSCKSCHCNVWGKPNLNIGCLDCNMPMQTVS